MQYKSTAFPSNFQSATQCWEKINKEKLIISLSMLARLHLRIIKKFSLHICYYGNSKFPSNVRGGTPVKPFLPNTINLSQKYCSFLFDSVLNTISCFTPLFLWEVNQENVRQTPDILRSTVLICCYSPLS